MQRLRNRGAKGGICPPWNFQIQVILPNFAPLRSKFGPFYHFYSTLPPWIQTLTQALKGIVSP